MLPFLARGAWPGLQTFAESGLRLAASGSLGRLEATSQRSYYGPTMSTTEPGKMATVNKGATKGPGGRSSTTGLTATVFGSNGFIGSYVVNQLAQRGTQVVCPYRCVDTEVQHIKQMGDLGQVLLLPHFSIHDSDERILQLIGRSSIVINLVGLRMESMNYSYEQVHIDWPARLARLAATSAPLERLIHFSEAGASETHTSRRMRTKALGDKAVREFLPSATILQPTQVVGIEDYFYNSLIFQVAYSIFAPLPDGGTAKLQPTYVHDVAEAVMQSLRMDNALGRTYVLGGPEVLTWREVYNLLIKVLRLNKDDTMAVPAWLLKRVWSGKDYWRRKLPNFAGMSFMQSADYVEEMIHDKVVPKGAYGFLDLEITPIKVTEGLPMEPVRHARVGGYRWGDFSAVVKDVPEAIKRYYNIK